MKAVLISIQPKWCELIASGKKTVEVRKSIPKLETPFKCYIYCTKGKTPYESFGVNKKPVECGGYVIGEFVCDKIFDICIEISKPDELPGYPFPCTGLTDKEILQYLGNGKAGYGWHISDLVIYDEPKPLSKFKKHNRICYYDHLGLATPKCKDCKGCQVERPPQSWCYVESEDKL